MLNWLLFQAAKPLGTVVAWLLFMSVLLTSSIRRKYKAGRVLKK